MNPNLTDPELIDRLASEYVVGTLRGPARRRFERWRQGSAAVDERCRFWEERLMPFAMSLEPLEPPARVWQGIRRRLNLSDSRTDRRWIQAWAMAAGILLVVALASLMYWRFGESQKATAVATIATPSGTPVWNVEFFVPPKGSGRITIHAGQLPARPADRDYELWVLPKGGKPVSLGLLPSKGLFQRVLNPAQEQALASSTQVAVSIEPAGGSPTGQPTGAIVFVAPLRAG